MAVLDPCKIGHTNYPEGQRRMLEGRKQPWDETAGTREVPFSLRIIY